MLGGVHKQLCSWILGIHVLALSLALHTSLSGPAAATQGMSVSGTHLSCQGHSGWLLAATD